jgi:Carboxypeptidase regulatory-like domain/TonB-dependent Receptor Plug Domain
MDDATLRRTRRRRWPAAAVALRFILPLLALLVAYPAAAQRNALEGTIRGRVVDESTSQPIADVHIEFIDGRTRTWKSAASDDEGNFVLDRVPVGYFRLRAERIGYTRALTPYWRIESGEILTVTVRLHTDAVLLAPLEITARARSRSPVVSNFYQRLERRVGGVFITREEIERSNAGLVTDLLRMVPGVQIQGGGGQHDRIITMVRAIPVTSFANGCPVQVYLDGMLTTRGGSVSLDELATPSVLEGIEIFRGLATVPPEFLSAEARCGVIALWTKRGG